MDGDNKLPIRAFLFLSESENQVMMPGLTWEEFDRLINLDSGIDGPRVPYGYQSLEITGSSDQNRAEMEVMLRLSIESTGGRWVSVPLRMGNFHRLEPADVSGIDEYFMTVAADGSGYLLLVKTNSSREAKVLMRVSSRVEKSSTQSIEFRLPDVPSRVELTTNEADVVGEVIGRGDEAIRTISDDGRQTRFSIHSSGSNFLLRWGTPIKPSEDLPLLEVESRVAVRWDSPQDQPIASVRLTIRNVKGSIESFQLRLPRGSVVLDSPRLGTGGQAIEMGPANQSQGADVREITIPAEERQQRIDLNFDLQYAGDNATPAAPLGFRVPEVVGAIRHRGELAVQTSGEYRLRWQTRPWVRSNLGEVRQEGSTSRFYRFRFDRGSFELPLWLSAKERQLRLTSKSEVAIRDALASLEMKIEISGQASDGQLQLDDASWRISSIENVATGEQLESFRSDSFRVIEYSLGPTGETTTIRVRGERSLDQELGVIKFPIPQLIGTDANMLIQNSTVDLINSGRTLLVVDLAASKGLIRLQTSGGETPGSTLISSFRVMTQDVPAIVVGTLVDQPPRITLSSDASIELDSDQLRSTVDWSLTSPLDLEGRLPIRIPKSIPRSLAITADGTIDRPTDSAPATTDASNDLISLEPWVVTVDDVPATLRSLKDDRYELISERLSSGTMSIRWRHAQDRQSDDQSGDIVLISLPRPDIDDVTVRGAMRVALRGDQQLDLISIDSPNTSDLELDTLPRDPLRLRLLSRQTTHDGLTVRQAILRTAVGRNMRHEQVIATVQGGDNFRIDLPAGTEAISVEATIDGQSVLVARQLDTLVIPLPSDELSHIIDLRSWSNIDTASSFATVKPILRLPNEVGRLLWQVVAPTDSHVVWASPTIGRAMTWQFDRWRLYRQPTHTDQSLTAMTGGELNPLPPGNRYLYVGSDLSSFEVVLVSRAVLWIFVGSFVLSLAVMLTYFPTTRHPLTAVVVAVLFCGLLAIAPDASVLAGQFGIIALVLVIVMIAIRVLVTPTRGGRVFKTPSTEVRTTPSTRAISMNSPKEPGSVGSTETVSPPSPPEIVR